MALNLDDIRGLFEAHGQLAYSGEPVTQLEHALQSGALADRKAPLRSWSLRPFCMTSGIC